MSNNFDFVGLEKIYHYLHEKECLPVKSFFKFVDDWWGDVKGTKTTHNIFYPYYNQPLKTEYRDEHPLRFTRDTVKANKRKYQSQKYYLLPLLGALYIKLYPKINQDEIQSIIDAEPFAFGLLSASDKRMIQAGITSYKFVEQRHDIKDLYPEYVQVIEDNIESVTITHTTLSLSQNGTNTSEGIPSLSKPEKNEKIHKYRYNIISKVTQPYIYIGTVLILMLLIGVGDFLMSSDEWTPIHYDVNGIPMVFVPSGCFTMGLEDGYGNAQPAHEVCLDYDFLITTTEITQGQYGSPPEPQCNQNQQNTMSQPVNGVGDNYPRNCVTWEEANLFCESLGMRLPSEAEWEYTARGPDHLRNGDNLYPWGDIPNDALAIVRQINNPNTPGLMLPVGSMEMDETWVGALDMLGSLIEFTSTIYSVNGPAGPAFIYPYQSDLRETSENTIGEQPQARTTRVMRGNDFDHFLEARNLTYRYDEYYDFRFNTFGFRCVVEFNDVMLSSRHVQ